MLQVFLALSLECRKALIDIFSFQTIIRIRPETFEQITGKNGFFPHTTCIYFYALAKVNEQYTTIVKSNVLRRTNVPETREAGYQRQPNIRASERDEENEEPGRLSTVRQSFDLAACLGEHELLNKNENRIPFPCTLNLKFYCSARISAKT